MLGIFHLLMMYMLVIFHMLRMMYMDVTRKKFKVQRLIFWYMGSAIVEGSVNLVLRGIGGSSIKAARLHTP